MVKSIRLLSILQIIFFLLNFHIISSYISLPFSYMNKKNNLPKPNTTNAPSYYDSLYKYPVYSSLKVKDKFYSFHITFDRYATYIKHDSSESNKDDYSLEYIGISEAELSTTSFTFLENNKNNITVNDFSIFKVKKLSDVTRHERESNFYAEEVNEIGLNVYKGNKIGEIKNEQERNNGYKVEEQSNLLEQLKSKNIITSKTFMVKYDNKNEEKGNIIIGGFPKEYSENKFIYNNISFYQNFPSWKIVFNQIKYGGGDFNLLLYGDLSINFGFIQANIAAASYFDSKFFLKYIEEGKCKDGDTGNYIYKYCRGEDVISQFETISFYLPNSNNENKDNTLKFDYKDLFIKSEDEDIYYFQIVFARTNKEWVFGRPFFKKYPTVFDQEKKTVGFYLKSGNNNGNKDFSSNQVGKNGRFAVVFIFVLVLCSILLIALLYFKCSVSGKKEPKSDLNEKIKNTDDENEKNSLNA